MKRQNEETNSVEDASCKNDPSNEPPAKKKKKKKLSTKDISPQVLQVRRAIQKCCSTDDWNAAHSIYQDAVEKNTPIEAQTFSNMLSLCGGLGQRSVHVGSPRPQMSEATKTYQQEKQEEEEAVSADNAHALDSTTTTTNQPTDDLQARFEFAFRLKQHMERLDMPLSENAYTALIRLYIKVNDFQQAQLLLQEAKTKNNNMKPKLRLYSSLLCAYCKVAKMTKAVELWMEIVQEGFILTEKEYQSLLHCATMLGNSQVFAQVLSELTNVGLVPSKGTIRIIVSWFESQHAVDSNDESQQSTEILTLPAITDEDLLVMGPIKAKHGWTISHACRIDTTSGKLSSGCLQGQILQPATMTPNSWKYLMEMNQTIVTKGMLENHTSEFQGGGKGKKKLEFSLDKRNRYWQTFLQYCREKASTSHDERIWDVVLDGANIGYYEQNFADAPKHVDYNQIEWVVQHFLSQKKRVLLVLHTRHFQPSLMPSWAVPLVKKWSPLLYKTPSGCNDDWFWFHAALYSGPNTLVVTNDEMRDHYFQMLLNSYLDRWKERHQVHFSFGEWTMGNRRSVVLEYPQPYSRRIQLLKNKTSWVIPLPKRGDSNRFLDGTHVATDKEANEETYLCISPRHEKL